jgi:hypothetical protein
VAGVVSIGHAQPGNTGGIWVTGLPALPWVLVRAALDGELIPHAIAATTAPAALIALRLQHMDIREEWEIPTITPRISQKERAARTLAC